MKRLAGYLPLAVLVIAGLLVLRAQEQPGAPNLGQEAAKEYGHAHLALWKLANFILFAGALGWFLAKKGGPFFVQRTERIRRGITEAAELRAEAETRYAEIERRLAGLATEIENLRGAARAESAAEAERIRQEAERDLAKVRTQAEQEIASAGKAVVQELRAYSAGLAISLAERRIRESMTADIERELVDSAIRQLERAEQQQNVVEAS